MIEVKRVEIRDRATCIPAIALRVSGAEDRILRRAGFGDDRLVILIHLERVECRWDAYNWGYDPRTMFNAHLWLQRNWDEHEDGGVVDVEFILGETKKPKESECQA